VPERPVRGFARRRARSELPLPGAGTVFHAHDARDENDGTTITERPPSLRRDGADHCRGREARALSTVSLRKRAEVPLLPRQSLAALAIQWCEPCNGLTTRSINRKSGSARTVTQLRLQMLATEELNGVVVLVIQRCWRWTGYRVFNIFG
jgi:hypothetical protein